MIEHPEQHLWLAVIQQAIQDATSKSIEPHLRHEAIAWLTSPNRDFDDVCECAGKDPVKLRRVLAKRFDALLAKPRSAGAAHTRRVCTPRLITFDGKTMSIPQWAKHLGIKVNTLQVRFAKAWTPEEALTRPTLGRWKTRCGSHPRHRGEVSNSTEHAGTGGGRHAHDLPELEISLDKDPT